jgi:hypothetical protein
VRRRGEEERLWRLEKRGALEKSEHLRRGVLRGRGRTKLGAFTATGGVDSKAPYSNLCRKYSAES